MRTIIIIGVLVAIAIPVYGAVVRNAANRAHASNIRILIGAAQMHIAEVGLADAGGVTYGPTANGDVSAALLNYIEDWPIVPDQASVNPDPSLAGIAAGTAVTGGGTTAYRVVISTDGDITVTGVGTMAD